MDTVLAPSAPVSHPAPPSPAEIDRRIEQACAQACATIAPAWPLDRAIAVNPHWQRIGQRLRTVAARLAVLGGVAVLPPRER
ncbi:putative inorganic carbon transporter subunit DabA, partial [Rubrivivax gelatinosus]